MSSNTSCLRILRFDSIRLSHDTYRLIDLCIYPQHVSELGKNHGAPADKERKVGSLGNIVVTEDGKCVVSIEDEVAKLLGPHSIIGRSIVIYASEDDCGRGGHELSLSTGNAGARVAAGVIGLAV
mmetsp:Transcript_1945/g.3869  ORF Transcript_1945/g.3869 Transcript_1945/m.3869 type:complete len:125 (+) Transcript_1945:1780-2154(+)